MRKISTLTHISAFCWTGGSRGDGEEGLCGVCGWGGWRGDFLKADRGSEMEHVAYREISTESGLMNAPLCPCYNGKRRLHDIFFFFSLLCPCPGAFLGNKGCERISDHAQKGCVATLTVRIAHCVKQQWGWNSFSSLFCSLWATWVTDNVTDPHMTHTQT